MDLLISYTSQLFHGIAFPTDLIFICLAVYYYYVVRSRLSIFFVVAAAIRLIIDYLYTFFDFQSVSFYIVEIIDIFYFPLIAFLFYRLYKESVNGFEEKKTVQS